MTDQAKRKQKAAQRTADRITVVLQNFVFIPRSQFKPTSLEEFDDGRYCLHHPKGWFACDKGYYQSLFRRISERFQNVSPKTIEKKCHDVLMDSINIISEGQEVDWTTSFALQGAIEIQMSEALLEIADELHTYFNSLIYSQTVFVPLTGIQLDVPEYDFGPVKLVRTEDSLPVTEKDSTDASFRLVHPDIYDRFISASCLVECRVTGGTAYVREEGLRLAGQLTSILNLHLGRRSSMNLFYQKIQCAGIDPSDVTIILSRLDKPAEGETDRPTYLHKTRAIRVMKRPINSTQLSMIKDQGFEEIWDCLELQNGDERQRRIKRAVLWHEKAVHFDQPDAQFVGLATALEILLVSKGSASNLFRTWAGITQQLAERCAFLLGHDLESTMDMAARIKQLYAVRSKIVHSGEEPTKEDLSELNDLVSRVILDFVQRDFSSFSEFEDWITRMKYSSV